MTTSSCEFTKDPQNDICVIHDTLRTLSKPFNGPIVFISPSLSMTKLRIAEFEHFLISNEI